MQPLIEEARSEEQGSIGSESSDSEGRALNRRNTPAVRRLTLLGGLALLLGCSAPERIDWLLYNGKIVTLDDQRSIYSAIALHQGRIVEVGDTLRSKYTASQEMNLGRRTVTPGFIDSHTHIRGWAQRYIHLPELASIEEISKAIERKAAELGPDEWITGYGWSEDELAEGRRPLRSDLDLAAPRNPVLLTRAGGHSAVANSLALELAGLDRDSPNPERGIFEHDERGELNGIIRERQDIVGRLVPRPSTAEIRSSFVANLKDLFRHGITSIVQASDTTEGYSIWQEVYEDNEGELPRASVQLLWSGAEEMEAFALRTGDGDNRLRVGAVKIFVDGGFTGPAAYTIDPYRGQPDYRGKLSLSEADLRRIIGEAHNGGWQLGIHAIGDAAIELTVSELAAALEAAPRQDHRHYLNHFTLPPPIETMRTMAQHEIHITQQPNFTFTLEGRYVANLDGYRLEHNNPLRSAIDEDIFVAISSDILPIGPMLGIYAAVTRKGMSGRVFAKDEALTVEEALVAYTRNGAFLTFEEDLKGTLEPGKLADLIVFSEDPLTIDPERLLDVEIDATFLDGRLVWERTN